MNSANPEGTRTGRRAGRSRCPGERRDRGALSLLLAVLFIPLACLAGLVVDGGAKLNADQNAIGIAQEAARAGAALVDPSTAYATGTFVVDEPAAILAARAYLAAVQMPGLQGRVTADGATAIEVTVTLTTATRFLALIGIDSMTSTATARAVLRPGGG